LELRLQHSKILSRKFYISPVVTRIELDKSISLVMMTTPPVNPPGPRGGGSKGADEPFKSTVGDKPFS
jgi:hypothetical protein